MARGVVKYDFAKNKITVLGFSSDLDVLRSWICSVYRPLAERYVVKTIRKNSVYIRNYDWEHILNVAREELIVLEWYSEVKEKHK